MLKEQIKASQTIKMIKNDIKELENLKNKVIEEDFEKLTQRIIPVRNKVTEAVNEFLELNVPVMMDPCISLDQANVNDHDSNENLGQNLQIHADNQQKKSYLISWNSLTKELFDLSAMVNSIATLLVVSLFYYSLSKLRLILEFQRAKRSSSTESKIILMNLVI